MTPPRVLLETDVRAAVSMADAIVAVRKSLVAVADGAVENPAPWHLAVPPADGELHVKGAYLTGAGTFAVKAASGWPGNAARGLPTSDGFTAVFDADTGRIVALLLDGGYLTELRTGAAGAVAADLFAPPDLEVAAIVGAGGQARFQLEGLLRVRRPRHLLLASRTRRRAEQLAEWASGQSDWDVTVADTVEEAVRPAQLVCTVTPARAPVVRAEWLAPGAHVTAVGSDSPGKRELDVQVLTAARLVAADGVAQSQSLGELQGIPVESLQQPPVLLGALLTGRAQIPAGDSWTVADLTGLGAEDAAVAALAVRHD